MRTFAELDDQQCAALAQQGDKHAFSALVTRHQDAVYRFLVRLTRMPDTAQDLTQDTFLRAYQGMAAWRPDAQWKTWVFRIARNLSIDLLRRGQYVHFVELTDEHDTASAQAGPEARMETVQRYHMLEAALAKLVPEHREILLLREIEDMSYEEIAAILDINPGTVKSRIARARAALLTHIDR
ncbi:sigma-70 family RNA polymerase sigma factor [Alcaligenaceae bacterium CGII-47]|nr:sigma-70 family RNA polymerase sigma factor [Alcaligenaceae bacterium CGII-47]